MHRIIHSFEIDDAAIEIAKENMEGLQDSHIIHLVQTDLTDKEFILNNTNCFDTVVMNPPFGTKHNQGIDMILLKAALQCSKGAVYSLHKLTTLKVIVYIYIYIVYIKRMREVGI